VNVVTDFLTANRYKSTRENSLQSLHSLGCWGGKVARQTVTLKTIEDFLGQKRIAMAGISRIRRVTA
jgi:hypothetical protein